MHSRVLHVFDGFRKICNQVSGQRGVVKTDRKMLQADCGFCPSASYSKLVERPSSPYTVESVVKYKCDWLYTYDDQHRGVATVWCINNSNWAQKIDLVIIVYFGSFWCKMLESRTRVTE